MARKYYKTKAEAVKAAESINRTALQVQVYKMPKGTRKAGYYAVCSALEYLNTY